MSADREDWTGASTSAGRESGGGRRGGEDSVLWKADFRHGTAARVDWNGSKQLLMWAELQQWQQLTGQQFERQETVSLLLSQKEKTLLAAKDIKPHRKWNEAECSPNKNCVRKRNQNKIIKMVFSYLFVLFLIHSKLTVLKSEKTVRFAERNNFFTQSAHFFG